MLQETYQTLFFIHFKLCCILLPSTAAFPRQHSACSVPKEEQVDTHEQQTRDRLCTGEEEGGGGGGLVSSMPALMTSILHCKWHTDAFKLI